MSSEKNDWSEYNKHELKDLLSIYNRDKTDFQIRINSFQSNVDTINQKIDEIQDELDRRKEFKHGDIVEFHLISCSAPEKRILLSIDNGPLKAYDKNGLCVAGLQDIVNQENYGACYTVIGNVFDGE